jgi:ribosomal-protein-alanine acetyltransferase
MIKLCEEILLNSNPCETDLRQNDFLIRFRTNRTPCIIHTIEDKTTSLLDRIQHNERLIFSKGYSPNYRIVYVKEYRDLDAELFKCGYEKCMEGIVKVLDIDKIKKELFTFASYIQNGVFIEEEFEDHWMSNYIKFLDMPDGRIRVFHDNMLRSEANFYYFTLLEQDVPIGVAYGSLERGIFTVCDIVIAPRYRGLSYSKKLLMSMLSYAYRFDAELVIAEVEDENVIASRLFDKIGFEDGYRFWERYKENVDNE